MQVPYQDERVELIVGADSTIGAELFHTIQSAGRPVLGTSRRTSSARKHLFLDLAKPPQAWNHARISIAYLCAAVARLEACKNDPAVSAQVNIEGMLQVAQILLRQGAFVVFLSTNHVFDGTRARRGTTEIPCPTNEYGRQKAETENRLLALGQPIALLRLTKVLARQNSLFADWIKRLSAGQRIHPFSDMVMAPVPSDLVCSALQELALKRRAGIWHLSGDRDMTYEEAAYMGARELELRTDLIEPKAMKSILPHAEPPPRHTTLESSSLLEILKIHQLDVGSIVVDQFRLQQQLLDSGAVECT